MIKDGFGRVSRVPGQIVESMGRRGKYLHFCTTDNGVLISPFAHRGQKAFYYQTKHLNIAFYAHFLPVCEDSGVYVCWDLVLWNSDL